MIKKPSEVKAATESFEDVLVEELKDPAFRNAFYNERNKSAVARAVVDLRRRLNLTQREFAKQVGLQQPAIARVENDDYAPNWRTLLQIAEKLGAVLQVEFLIPAESDENAATELEPSYIQDKPQFVAESKEEFGW